VSVDVISWKRIKKLNRRLDERFVHAFTGQHYIWSCIRPDGTMSTIDVRDPKVVESVPGGTTTAELLRTRQPYWEWEAELLAELERRIAELEAGR
jgi:hypothetical protein